MKREKLLALIRERSLKIAEKPVFRLSSGKMSRFYIDLKQVTFDPFGVSLIAELLYGEVVKKDPTHVGGLTLGADPLTYAVSLHSLQREKVLRPLVVRKEPKDHGTGKQVEGIFSVGDRVAILEDVVTTGGSSLKAAKACQREGLEVVGIFAVVDREEGGRENIKREGFELYSLFRMSDLL
jgi:orotate phosphoribosyltransferase